MVPSVPLGVPSTSPVVPELSLAANTGGRTELGVQVVVGATQLPDGQPVLAAQRQRHKAQRDVGGHVEDEAHDLSQHQPLQRPAGGENGVRGLKREAGGLKREPRASNMGLGGLKVMLKDLKMGYRGIKIGAGGSKAAAEAQKPRLGAKRIGEEG